MTEYTKPKYKNLLSYLHSKNHYLNIKSFNDDNKEELLSNFTIEPVKHNSNCEGGKCFCGKKLKNVFFVYCILTNKVLMVGGNCKTLFTGNKKKRKQQFINRTIELFRNNLGFEPIFNWNSFIGEALISWLKTNTIEELEAVKLLYNDNKIINDEIDKIINKKNEIPILYNHFLEELDYNKDYYPSLKFNSRIKLYNRCWKYYLKIHYDDRINILTFWYNKDDKKIYEFIHKTLREIEREL